MEMGFLLAYLVAEAYLRNATLCASWEGKHKWWLIGEYCNRGELLVGTGGGLLCRHTWWLSDMRKISFVVFTLLSVQLCEIQKTLLRSSLA